jgi:hypothetical protein
MAVNFQSNVLQAGVVYDPSSGNYLQINSSGQIGISSSVTLGAAQICDGVTNTLKATVAQFHNADNQALGAGYGLCTGGITQILNTATGNLDRSRAAGYDQMAASGITAGQGYKAMAFQVGTSTAIGTAGQVTITLTGATGLKGTNHGVPWSIQVGTELIYDYGGANQENVLVTAVNAGTPSITFTCAKTHGASVIVVGFSYNQERDASGECDGASGAGTAIAAEYEFNAGGPGGANNYDRARNIMSKGIATASLSGYSGGTGQSSLTLSAGPAVSGPGSLQPGMMILLYGAAGITGTSSQVEAAYVGLNYVPGATTVPIICGTLASPGTINAYAYTTIAWDSFVQQGPASSGFLPFGIGCEADTIFNPVDGKMYLQRAACGNTAALLVSSDQSKATFRAGGFGNTLYSTAAAVILEIQGSATKTIRIKKISLYAVSTSATFFAELTLGRATTVGGGTPAAQTPQKMDSNDAGATAVLNIYTGASTSGTGYAAFSAKVLPCVTGAAGVAVQSVTWDFCQNQDQALVLRGTSQWVEVFNNTLTLTGAKFGFDVEWEEDNS